MTLAELVGRILGKGLPVKMRFYDGSEIGDDDSPVVVGVEGPDALRRILFAPGELGVARAYVAGDLTVDGDLLAALKVRHRMPVARFGTRDRIEIARLIGSTGLKPVPPPPEEIRMRGRFHSRPRDAKAVSHHYDVSNDFYMLLLGPTMTYSCALWSEPDADLARSQWLKHDLVCRKLALCHGMRILDAGCGWGTMAVHAAAHHGVSVVGVTLSEDQREYAVEQAERAGVADRVEIRLQDYRDISDGPFDAVASIGMLEHVGSGLADYGKALTRLLTTSGRFLHHAISRPPFKRAIIQKPTFIDRYVFPDADLHEIGTTTSAIQAAGLEAVHMESLRSHYALTLRAWLQNLERNWDESVALIGLGRARVWRLYIAAAVLGFEENRLQIHQVLSVKSGHGPSGTSLVPGDWHHQ